MKCAAYKSLKEETLIPQLGNVWLQKLGTPRKNDVSQRMRQLSRLKLELSHDGAGIQLMDYLTEGRFDEILSAIESVAGLQENAEGILIFEIPSSWQQPSQVCRTEARNGHLSAEWPIERRS